MTPSQASPLWILSPSDPEKSGALARALSISPFLAQLLLNRGIENEAEARLFLEGSLKDLHTPFALADMDKAVDRLMVAIERKERISVYGDYDVDGTTSSALLFDFFRDLGIEIEVYIPNRAREGYSLNRGALDTLQSRGVKVLITVDNGIAAFDCAAYAKVIGLDLIITDHHALGDRLPEAVAVVNVNRLDNTADFSGVAGVGVAFYLAMALRKRLREIGFFGEGRMEPNLGKLLDLVALGTVADVAPLSGQNRILVKHGLSILRKGERPGLKCLSQVSGLKMDGIDVTDIGFRLGPRINAGGRIGEPMGGFYLLTAETLEVARPYALKLDQENEKRRRIEDEMLVEAEALFESQADSEQAMACMVAKRNWNVGVIGLIASRLVSKYRRPAIAFAWDGKVWKGSARSIPSFAIHEAIGACSAHLIQFGGHPQAAGLSVSEEKLQNFYAAFDAVSRDRLNAQMCRRRVEIDMALLEPISTWHLEELTHLEPTGMGNRAPVFLYEGVQVSTAKPLSEGKHLKLQLKMGSSKDGIFEAISFGSPEHYFEIARSGKSISIAFRPELNTWNGATRLQLRVVDLMAK